jgi:hypothetical protein
MAWPGPGHGPAMAPTNSKKSQEYHKQTIKTHKNHENQTKSYKISEKVLIRLLEPGVTFKLMEPQI